MRNWKILGWLLMLMLLCGASWSPPNLDTSAGLTTNDNLHAPSTAALRLYLNSFQPPATVGTTYIVGVTPGCSTLAAAVTTIGSTVCKLLCTTSQILAANLTTPATLTLSVNPGAIITLGNYNLTISGPFQAGLYQVFNCSGTGAVSFGAGTVSEIYSEWWGAVANNSTDCTSAIKAAIASLPQSTTEPNIGGGIIRFVEGQYDVVAGQIVVSGSYIKLVGSGGQRHGATRLVAKSGSGPIVQFLGTNSNMILGDGLDYITLDGNSSSVTGADFSYCASIASFSLCIRDCNTEGLKLTQCYDSSFYTTDIVSCGSTNNGALHIYNGSYNNTNNIRFYSLRIEGCTGYYIWLDTSGAGGNNYAISFYSAKLEGTGGTPQYGVYASGVQPNTQIYFYSSFIARINTAIYWDSAGYIHWYDGEYWNDASGTFTGINLAAGNGHYFNGLDFWAGNATFTNYDVSALTASAYTILNSTASQLNTNPYITVKDAVGTYVIRGIMSKRLIKNVTPVSTSGTGEQALMSYTIPAGYLSYSYPYGLKITAFGIATGANASSTLTMYLGNSSVAIITDQWAGNWRLDCTFQMTNSNETLFYTIIYDSNKIFQGYATWGQNPANAMTFKLTGNCTNAGDVLTQSYLSVKDDD